MVGRSVKTDGKDELAPPGKGTMKQHRKALKLFLNSADEVERVTNLTTLTQRLQHIRYPTCRLNRTLTPTPTPTLALASTLIPTAGAGTHSPPGFRRRQGEHGGGDDHECRHGET